MCSVNFISGFIIYWPSTKSKKNLKSIFLNEIYYILYRYTYRPEFPESIVLVSYSCLENIRFSLKTHIELWKARILKRNCAPRHFDGRVVPHCPHWQCNMREIELANTEEYREANWDKNLSHILGYKKLPRVAKESPKCTYTFSL